MMTSLRNASRRGARIISFNPFRERALERFQAPQAPVEMITLSSTQISNAIYQVRVGGDLALLKGMMKAILEAEDDAVAFDRPSVLDHDFIRGHTIGFEALVADVQATDWEDIARHAGLSRSEITEAANVYIQADNTILVYGMGITQHRYGTQTVQQLANLLHGLGAVAVLGDAHAVDQDGIVGLHVDVRGFGDFRG